MTLIPSSVIRHGIAPLWAIRERSPYLRICRRLRRDERMDPASRRFLQFGLLRQTIERAWSECAYYRERFAGAGFEPGDFKSWDDLKHLPLLTKADIVANSGRMVSASARRSRLVPRKTSGSTGVSLHFCVDDRQYQFKRGVACYRDMWTGWQMGEWRAMVWGNPTYLHSLRGRIRNALLERTFYLDTLRMDEDAMHRFAREVLRRRPTMLFGHAHSLYLFACFWQQQGYPEFRFRGLISTAMVLHPFERQKCETTFGGRVFDRYGCEEVSLIASECEAHAGLHENTDSLAIELIRDGRECAPGETGAVVVTDLRNHAMPFIRYQVGDMATRASRTCPCGRSYPLLEGIAGRIADYLRTPEGHWVSGISLTENFATLVPGLHQIQIVQTARDRLTLRVVAAESFNDESRRVMGQLVLERFGPLMHAKVDMVPAIEPGPSGKYRFTIYAVDDRDGRVSGPA